MHEISCATLKQQQKQIQQNSANQLTNFNTNSLNRVAAPALLQLNTSALTCNIISSNSKLPRDSTVQLENSCNSSASSSSSTCSLQDSTQMSLMSLRRRRLFQRNACLLSILLAFVFGLALGVLLPMYGLPNVFGEAFNYEQTAAMETVINPKASAQLQVLSSKSLSEYDAQRPPSDFPSIYELKQQQVTNNNEAAYTVAFIKHENQELSAEEVFRNAFHLEQDKQAGLDALIVKKLEPSDGSIKEFKVQRTASGRFLKGPERRLSKPSLSEQLQHKQQQSGSSSSSSKPLAQRIVENAHNSHNQAIIKQDIYWGDMVEKALPQGFSQQVSNEWNRYVHQQGVVKSLEPGCGRMQNRMIIFADGTKACARYRQNTDQIQGELFSFYLGQLLNLSNLAPSSATVINLETRTWSGVIGDITQAQWKQQRPVVLTRWLPDLEPAGIPQPFQPLERHLNKYDVWNITLGSSSSSSNGNSNSSLNQASLSKPLESISKMQHHQSLNATTTTTTTAATAKESSSAAPSSLVMQRLIELAQWSDLIVFDYLIANLDRVVNNLYNYQWNADIMAAPAHNLARQTNSQLLVFLDNESGLLHGYRLLKKYEAYHGLLLDNLCVFRQPTIEALRQLRAQGIGHKLRELFEKTTSAELRDVLPSLPDKSIKILVDRIDRVLGQVQKCKDLLADR